MTEPLVTRRALMLGSLPAAVGAGAFGSRAAHALAGPSPVVNARDFGASPSASAVQNSRAFAEASAAINRAGGGTLVIPAGVYRVGYQVRGQNRPGNPPDIIRIEGCTRPVVLAGTGVVLRAADGLRYGSFHPRTGRRHDPARLPFTDFAYRVDAYRMILVRNCRGSVAIEGFELDGNLDKYELGGQWDNLGRQIYALGIMLESNTGGVTVSKVNSHHHGLDGIMISHAGLTPSSPRYPVTLTDVICDSNARQGLSWVGGTQLTATRCRFSRTGRSRFASAPSAGVDVEAESSVCRNGRFVDCRFVDNAGVGFVAESGDAANMRLERCTFIGTTSWAAWPRKPGIVFQGCTFVGGVINAFADVDPRHATQFVSCTFSGDRKLSPTGAIFGEFLLNLGGGATNIVMKGCRFNAVDPAVALAWTPADARFQDCTFRQLGRVISRPRGIFSGTNRIDSAGEVDLAGSRFLGSVFLNGRRIA